MEANEALRRAMAKAAVSRTQLAAACEVDAKTVDRWLRDDQRIPHARQRWAVGEKLGVEAGMIWPSANRKRSVGAEREIVAAYPTRAAMPSTSWTEMITDAKRDLVFAGYTNYFLWLTVPSLRDILASKAREGASVRFLMGDPDSEVSQQRETVEAVPLTVSARIRITTAELEHLRDTPGLEVRYSDRHIAMSVWAFDDQMVVCTHLSSLVGHDSPTLRLQRSSDDGLFAAYLDHVNALWQDAQDTWR